MCKMSFWDVVYAGLSDEKKDVKTRESSGDGLPFPSCAEFVLCLFVSSNGVVLGRAHICVTLSAPSLRSVTLSDCV